MQNLIRTFDTLANEYREYLSCMKLFRTDAHPLVDFFFRIAITRMSNEIASKKNATENFRLGWENKH